MAITAMGLGSKTLEGDYNLDPQQQFWSFLGGLCPQQFDGSRASGGVILSGFYVKPTDPAGLCVQIGRDASTVNLPDSAYAGGATDWPAWTLFTTDGKPQVVNIPSAPSSGTAIYDILSYCMPANTVAVDKQTPGTPELVKTIAVTGANGGVPTAAEITAVKEPGAYPGYIRWARVSVKAGQTAITDDDIQMLDGYDGASGGTWMIRTNGLVPKCVTHPRMINYYHQAALTGYRKFTQNGTELDWSTLTGRYSYVLGMWFGTIRNIGDGKNWGIITVKAEGDAGSQILGRTQISLEGNNTYACVTIPISGWLVSSGHDVFVPASNSNKITIVGSNTTNMELDYGHGFWLLPMTWRAWRI